MKNYFYTVLLSLDQFVGTITGLTSEDETISSKLGKHERAGTTPLMWKPLVFIINTISPTHLQEAIEEDEK